MAERHQRLDGHEFEQALGVGDGQGGLACCSPWGLKESDLTEQLNHNKKEWTLSFPIFRVNPESHRSSSKARVLSVLLPWGCFYRYRRDTQRGKSLRVGF